MSTPTTSSTKPLVPDKRLADTLFAEVGGGHPDEVAAVASTFLNLAKQKGLNKALKASSAYRKQSPEYQKAQTGNMNPYEQAIYQRNTQILSNLVNNPDQIQPFTNFENVKAFGDPIAAGKWPKEMASWPYQDIGRQRFYSPPPNPRVTALKGTQ